MGQDDDIDGGWNDNYSSVQVKDPEADRKVEKPKLWKVVLFNDDFTPINWVVSLLISLFNKEPAEAHLITTSVHKLGKGIAGIYSRDIAETKSYQANQLAKKEEHPFLTAIEPE